LEGFEPHETVKPKNVTPAYRPARIREYSPNRVALELEPGASGYLVLADLWFPGWTCTVDDRPAPVYRANFAFRGVELPSGARRVVFAFTPRSYVRGKAISTGAAGVVIALTLVALVARMLRRTRVREPERKAHVVPS
jgi:uncharacterized membrane protein YfhO